MRREKVEGRPGHYAYRRPDGTFGNWASVGRSLAADRRQQVGSTNIPRDNQGRLKSGYGHRGDYQGPDTLPTLREIERRRRQRR